MWKSSLQVVMERRHISQAQLGRMTGLTKPTIRNAYHGYTVSPLTMVRIARALDVPLTVLDPVAAQELEGLRVR